MILDFELVDDNTGFPEISCHKLQDLWREPKKCFCCGIISCGSENKKKLNACNGIIIMIISKKIKLLKNVFPICAP